MIIAIAIVTLLLLLCIAVDSADDTINNVGNSSVKINTSNIKVANNTPFVGADDDNVSFVVKSSDKIHIIKDNTKKKAKKVKKLPTISMWAKPSVRSGYSYTWHKFVWVDYCPNCKHYNVLLKNPKGVPEREYTCKRCDSDFCAVTGKEKYSWSHVYLTKA